MKLILMNSNKINEWIYKNYKLFLNSIKIFHQLRCKISVIFNAFVDRYWQKYQWSFFIIIFYIFLIFSRYQLTLKTFGDKF